MQELSQLEDIVIGSGTLNRVIRQLMLDGWIEEARVDPEVDPQRRYYRLPDRGDENRADGGASP